MTISYGALSLTNTQHTLTQTGMPFHLCLMYPIPNSYFSTRVSVFQLPMCLSGLSAP